MSEHVSKQVFLEPTEVQRLQLQLAQRDYELNVAQRSHLEAEIRFHQLARSVAETRLPGMQEQLAAMERDGSQLVHKFLAVGEQIKVENGWPDAAQLDAMTLTYSAPAQNGWAAVPELSGENKVRIH